MNISSLIIRVQPNNAAQLIQKLNNSGLCECHIYENGKIIITIEGNNTGHELEKISCIKEIPEVISVDLIYAYSEFELELARENIENSSPMPEWLNNDNIEANDIKYSGNIGR